MAKSRTGLLLFMLVLVIPACFAQSNSGLYIIKNNLISFHSNTNLELIRGISAELKGVIDSKKRTFAFSIAIATFDGFNSPLQKEHFNENCMESDKFQKSSFKGSILNLSSINFSKDGEYNAEVAELREMCERIKQSLVDSNLVVIKETKEIVIL